jgi:addiction module HigA family antidote
VDPVHPGEILREDFLKPLNIAVNKLALELHVPATRMTEIVHGRRRVTADTALRLARYFQTNAEFWLNLQNSYDLEVSRRSEAGAKIDVQVRPVGEIAGGERKPPARVPALPGMRGGQVVLEVDAGRGEPRPYKKRRDVDVKLPPRPHANLLLK